LENEPIEMKDIRELIGKKDMKKKKYIPLTIAPLSCMGDIS